MPAQLVVREVTARRREETAWLHSGDQATARSRGDDGATSFSPVIPSLSPSSSSSLPPLGFLDLANDGSTASLAAGAGFGGALLLASALSAWAFARGGGGAGAVLATVLQIGPLLACCCRRLRRRSPSSPLFFLRWLAFSAMTNNPHYPMKMQ